MQSIVKRAEVRVDLLLQIAGQEAEPLAGFNRRAYQNNPVDLVGRKRLNGRRDSQVSFSRTGWPDSKNNIVILNGFEISLLAGSLRVNATSQRPVGAAFAIPAMAACFRSIRFIGRDAA